MTDIATVNLTLNAAAQNTTISVQGPQGTPGVIQSIDGTTNQVNVVMSGAGNSIATLSTPQNIATSSSPTFSTLTLSSSTASTSPSTGALVVTGGVGIGGAVNALSFTPANVFNVVAYGATGNGTTNDATAIQSAVTAACGSTSGYDSIGTSGGIVYFPQNAAGNATYLITSTLTDSGYGIMGIICDPGVVITTNSATHNQLINFTHCQAVNGFIEGGRWVHGANGGISLSNTSGDVQLWKFSNIDFFQKWSGGTGNYSFSVSVPIICAFDTVRFLYSSNGLLLTGGTSCDVRASYALQVVGVGFDVNDTNYTHFSGCGGDYNGVTYRTRGSSANVSFKSCGHELGTATNLTVTNSSITGSTCVVTYSGTDISSQFVTGMPVAVNCVTNTNCNGRWWVSAMSSNTITFTLYTLPGGATNSPGNVSSADTGTISIYCGDGFQFLNSYNVIADNCNSQTPQQATSAHYAVVNSQYSGFSNCRGVTGSGGGTTAQTWDIDAFKGNSNTVLVNNYIQTSQLGSGVYTLNSSVNASDFLTAPTYVATSTANVSGQGLSIGSSYYNGSSAVVDTWTINETMGGGATPGSALYIKQTGAPGNPSFNVQIGNASYGGTLGIIQNTAATGSNNYNSPTLQFQSKYYNGTSSVSNTWSFQDVLGSGTTPTSTYTIAQSGTSGTATLKLNVSTASTSTTTGALVVTGGLGVGGAAYAGSLYDNGNRVVTGLTAGTAISISGSAPTGITITNTGPTSIVAGTDISVSGATGAVTVNDTSTLSTVTGRGATTATAVSITNTTNATSTSTGCLILSGGLGVASNIYLGGNLHLTAGSIYYSGVVVEGYTGSISAAGTTQGTATALSQTTINSLTTVAAGSGVILPSSSQGQKIIVKNGGANPVLLYPASGASIDGGSTNAPITIPVGSLWTGVATSSTAWWSAVPTLAGGSNIGITYGSGQATVAVTGTVPTATSATSATTATTATNIAGGAAGTIFYQTSSGTTATLAIGTAGQVLQVNTGATAPQWATLSATTATNISGGAADSIPYQTAASITGFIAAGTNGYVLTMVSGSPAWAANTGGVTSITGTSGQIVASASTGAVTLSLPAASTYGSITLGGVTGGYAGITYSGVSGYNTWMTNGTITGMYEIGTGWQWYVDSSEICQVTSCNGAWTVNGTCSATTFNATSDVSKKENIRTFVNAEEVVQNLRGVSFDWKSDGTPAVGVIAQEVEIVLPELVHTDDEGSKSVNYNGIVGVLIEEVKALRKELNALKAR